MSLSSPRNPMQASTIDLVGIKVHTEVDGNGNINLALDIANTAVSEVTNELEITNFVNLENLPKEERARKALYAGLLTRLDRENGKHYIVIDPTYSAELLAYINQVKFDYTDTLAKKANLLFSQREQVNQFTGLTSEYKIKALKNITTEDDLTHCDVIAKFQKDRLVAMRPSLPDAEALKRMDERYSTDALIKKAQSGRVIVISATKDKNIIATIVANLHATQEKSLLDNTLYLSDLIIEKDYISDENFVMQFLVSSIKKLFIELPLTKTITLMAPGDVKDPLVISVRETMKRGLFATLNKTEQTRLGLISYFVLTPQNNPKKHFTNNPANMFHPKTAASGGALVTLRAATPSLR